MSRLAVRFVFGALLWAASGAIAMDAGAAASPPADSVRGLWVPRTALVSPESIDTMVREAADGGFNTLLVQVRGRGEAFYRSAIEPRARDLDRQPGTFDPLATTIRLARQAGLAVHAWVNVNLVSSAATLPRSKDHVALQHPEWLMVPRALAGTLKKTPARSQDYVGALARWTRGATDQVEGLYLSPVTAGARAYTTSVIAELVARYDLDGVHLDYIRYPSAEFDFSVEAIRAFRDSLVGSLPASDVDRLDRAAAADPAAWASARPDEWAAFHRDRLTSLVRAIQGAVRAARPGVLVSAAVVGVAAEARERRHQDWPVWVKDGYLDIACPMLYALSTDQFAAVTAEIAQTIDPTPVWAGIGAYRLPIDGTIERVRLARRSHAAGVLLFSYEQLAESGPAPAALSALRPVLLEATSLTGRSR